MSAKTLVAPSAAALRYRSGALLRHALGREAAGERPPAETIATVVQRLAVVLEAGVAPGPAWRYLDDGSDSLRSPSVSPILAAIRETGPGGDVVEAIVRSARSAGRGAPLWRRVAAAYHVSELTGAPLATCLSAIASSLLDVGATERAVEVALAGPTASARVVLAAPVLAVVFGAALGFGTLSFLFGSVAGGACLAIAVLLVLLAHRWNRRLVREVDRRGHAPGLLLDLTVIALASGRSTASACAVVADALERCGLLDAVDPAEHADREGILSLSQRAGVPATLLLSAEAQAHRRDARTIAARNAERLATRLLLPLGLCVLPAFILVGVLPIVAGILASAVGVH